jgi:prophage regulatory protein
MKLIRLPTVLEMTGLSRTRLYGQVNAGTFPKPAKLGPNSRAIAWPDIEVQEWISERLSERAA